MGSLPWIRAGLLLVATSCTEDGGEAAVTAVRGVVMLSEPVVGAQVEVVRFDGGVRGATLCTTTTDARGAYDCALATRYGDLLVIAAGGTTTERGAAVTLPASTALRAPAWGVALQEQRTAHVTPMSELIVAVGLGRAAAGADVDVAASLARAHALVREHLEVDPVAVAPAALDAATSLTEAVKLALALRGLATLAATVADEQSLTPQALNTRTLLDRLVEDASSVEARLDGVGASGALTLGPACQLPSGCTVEGDPGCTALCVVQTNTLRARVAGAALAFLRSPDNRTGLTRDDALPWATHLQQNTSALFGDRDLEPLDTAGPVVTFAAPSAAAVFTGGSVAVDVTAADALGVVELAVTVGLATSVAIVDTDPSPERFIGGFAITAATPEGPLTFTATARDTDGNVTTATRTVAVDAVAGGALSGVAVKARLGGAAVAVYTYAGGVRGPTPIGTGTTAADGSFTNVAIADGVAGELLIEIRGGSYGEDSQPATTVTLDTTDRLRTVVPGFVDGGAVSGLVVSPLSELAVAYLGWLHRAGQGGASFPARWATARAAIEQLFGVASLDAVPSAPAQIDTLTAADRFGLVLVGISRLAWAASTSGGGDAGAFGPTINAMKVVTLWSRDVSDGCLDGRDGTAALSYGGAAALTDEALRLQLAQAIVAYLGDSARNVTAFSTPAEVLPLLDTLATGGGNAMPGACVATGPGTVEGRLFDDDGRGFDRDGPVVTFDGATPAAGAFVRGTIAIDAIAIDALDPAPALRVVEPAGTVDTDGDPTDRDAHAAIVTASLGDGPLTVALDASDHSGNHRAATRSFTIDNTPPTLTWATAGMVAIGADHWTATATPTLAGTVADVHAGTVVASWPGGSVAATVSGGAWSVTLPVAAALGLGGLELTITATDLAVNVAALTRHLRADVTAPTVGFLPTTVRQEDHDNVTFDPAIDPTYGVPTYYPTHAHSAAFSTTLGPATACDAASAPTVVKYAYLLDQVPRHAVESGGTDVGGGNALTWHLAPSDDGIGLTSVRWRVVAVATGAVLRDWVTLAAPVSTRVALHRTGVDGAAALGTTPGLLRLDVEATDAFARTTTVARCWNHVLLAAPIVLAPADQATVPTSTAADLAAGKWGLASLSLSSASVPAAPVSMMLTAGVSAGAGLFEFPIYNPTDEPVYVSVELDLPTAATWTRSSYDGRWIYRETTTSTSCGAVASDPGPPAIYEPNYALAGCESGPPAGNDPTLYADTNQSVPVTDFTIRAWTTDQLTPALTELSPCAGCSTAPSTAGRVRVTVLVPPRGADPTRPPVKVVLMASLRPSSAYRPHGTQATDPDPIEFAVGSQRLTGQPLGTATQCVQWSRPPGSISSAAFQCTRTRYLTRARYLNAISVQGVTARTMSLATGLTGTSTRVDIPHLPLPASQRSFTPIGGIVWSTSEPAPPAL